MKSLASSSNSQPVRAGVAVAPKKLSKAGEWLRANPKGLGVTIHDMKALMR